MAVELLIKSPNQQIEDFKIECDATWNIGQVKDYLCSAYPTKPKREEQKLIYSGRLLKDHLVLKDIISQAHNVHIMHLVCPQSVKTDKMSEETTVKQSNVKKVEGSVPFDASQSDGLRQRLTETQQTLSGVPLHPEVQMPQINATSFGSPVNPEYMAYQMAAMQQMYAQFLAQTLSQGYPFATTYPVAPFQTVPQTNAVQATETPQVVANPNPVVQEQRQPNNGENDAMDLLDWLYIFTRLAMLGAILYFYSSVDRILLVLSLGILFCIYRAGLFERRAQENERERRQESNIQTTPNSVDNSVQDSSSEEQHETREAEEAAVANTENENTPEPQSTVSSNSVLSGLSVALTVITTFFTSLIPDLPAPPNVN